MLEHVKGGVKEVLHGRVPYVLRVTAVEVCFDALRLVRVSVVGRLCVLCLCVCLHGGQIPLSCVRTC